MDNLLAEKKATPMLIVLTFGHALPYGQRGQPPRTNTTVFADYLLKDVIPMVEAKYRVAPGREQRAIAGFSMGGQQSLHIFSIISTSSPLRARWPPRAMAHSPPNTRRL